ncbi:MAG: HAD family phosphatase [Oscillospiraceae bacterium]|jgi:HAD superfamily hydrolase (TIGR01509 family)|nr:HAD family phosphatase [Oscillospiraceae bacterium]
MQIEKTNNIKGVIFDLDGTLLDSMWMWGEVAVRYITGHGATPRPGFVEALRPLNTIEEAQYYIDEYGIDLPVDEVIAGRDGMMVEFFSRDVKLKNGVLQFLDLLREHDVKMCVATASDRWLAEPALRLHGIDDYFGHVFTCGEEDTNKKSPDIFIRAAEFLGSDIGDTLVVEDALYAMKTAKKAGFIVAGVYDKSYDDLQDEIKAVCDYYVPDSMSQLSRYFA